MDYKEIFKELRKSADTIIKMEKEFSFVEKENFKSYEKYFTRSKYPNLLNQGINYKSKEYFHHLHAVEYKNIVQIHKDVGNTDKSILFIILHFIFDMMPHYSFVLLKRKNKLKQITQSYE